MSSRQSTIVRAARLVQHLPLTWLRVFEAPAVRLVSRSETSSRLVILLALPRSGSTLAYQVLIHGLKSIYLSNLWNMLYALPWVGGALSRRLCSDHQSDFQSNHGFVGGVCGPAEGQRFWSYWYGHGLSEIDVVRTSDATLHRRMRYLRRVFSALTNPQTPMVTGYIGHILVADMLREIFPEAVFVRLHRDPLSNAVSMLRSRQRGSGGWFSIFPQECKKTLDANVYAQIASQVYWLNRRLDAVRNDERTIHVAYEALCRNPNQELQRIVAYCNANGMDISIQRDLPSAFQYRVVHESQDKHVAFLAHELEMLANQHGPLDPFLGDI